MKNKTTWIKWGAGRVLPLTLVGLFELLKSDQARMGWWVDHVMAPVEQFLARIWSVFPAFSVAEVLTALVLIVGAVWLVRAVVLLIQPCLLYTSASEIWSQILSGCPSVTDSEVNSFFAIIFFLSFSGG